jgi:hypothetical protein
MNNCIASAPATASTLTPRLARLDEQLSGAIKTARHVLEMVRGIDPPSPSTKETLVQAPGCILDRLSALECLVVSLNGTLESIAGEM